MIIEALLSLALAGGDVYGLYNTGRSETDPEETGTLDVELHPCTDNIQSLCGTVRAVKDEKDPAAPQTMPDGSPIVGFVMIKDLEPRDPGQWRGGKINAIDESLDKGKMAWYGLKLDRTSDTVVTLTGCLGFICPRKIVWTRVEGARETAVETPVEAPAGE
jgi:hypothetical protein